MAFVIHLEFMVSLMEDLSGITTYVGTKETASTEYKVCPKCSDTADEIMESGTDGI